MTNNIVKKYTEDNTSIEDNMYDLSLVSDTSSDTSSVDPKIINNKNFLSSISQIITSDSDMDYIWDKFSKSNKSSKSSKSNKSNSQTTNSDFIWDKFYKSNKSNKSNKSSKSIKSNKNNNILLEKDNLSILIDNNNNVKIMFK